MDCRYCDEPLTEKDDERYGLHEQCEEHYVYCEICDDFKLDEGGSLGCRHVQWVGGFGYTGCGYSTWEDPELEYLRPGLSAYLAATGDGPALQRALLERDYRFQFQGPMIGLGWLRFEGGGMYRSHHDSMFLERIAENDIPELQYAVAWLVSLWREDDRCRPWEIKIASMIDEWLLARALLTP